MGIVTSWCGKGLGSAFNPPVFQVGVTLSPGHRARNQPQLTAFSPAGTWDTVLTCSLGARALSLHASGSCLYPPHLQHMQDMEGSNTHCGTNKRFCEESQPQRCTNYRIDLTS